MDSLDDDLVTKLLVQDAKDSSLKYSSMGLDAFKSTRYVAVIVFMYKQGQRLIQHQASCQQT